MELGHFIAQNFAELRRIACNGIVLQSFLVFTICKLRKFKILKTLNNVKWPSIILKSREITSFHFHSCICCINLLVTVQNYWFFLNGKVFAKQLRCTQFCAIPQNSVQWNGPIPRKGIPIIISSSWLEFCRVHKHNIIIRKLLVRE